MESLTKRKISQACLKKIYTYNILDDLKLEVCIKDNPYQISLDKLFNMAARKNKKRSFLFVSKVLGKHIPVNPYIPLIAGSALATRYMQIVHNEDPKNIKELINAFNEEENIKEAYESIYKKCFELPKNCIFIGFAETATALGQSMYSCFSNSGVYIHTTRESISNLNSIINFEEEHSHATSHRFYSINDNILKSEDTVVLVDDEITTGKTALNIIDSIQKQYPRKKYVVASLLDWRSDEDIQKFKEKEKELDISIKMVSLLYGNIKEQGKINEEIKSNTRDVLDLKNDCSIKYIDLSNFFENLISGDYKEGLSCKNPYLLETGRFGIKEENKEYIECKTKEIGNYLKKMRTGRNTLCLGTGEFMYIPMKIASYMGEGVRYHSTTRSPIYPYDKRGYGAKNAFQFECPEDNSITNYIYNIPYGYYDDIYIFFERGMKKENLNSILKVLKKQGSLNIFIVTCSGEIEEATPVHMGSYSSDDVIFLLKDISECVEEESTKDREKAIQSGRHYSEMLPIEYKPSSEYIDLFHMSLKESAEKIAIAVGVVAEKIIENRGLDIVITSLARAGTPIGILIKRYINFKYKIDIPHYSISIIRGKGIDENAISYIIKNHPDKEIQFVDGWTGKGAITKVLTEACEKFKQKYNIYLNDDLAALADPAYCISTFGTREDFLIPSACLNSTVSGLVSRTFHRTDLIKETDFHGAKYYKELKEEDVSNLFIDTICEQFKYISDKINKAVNEQSDDNIEPTWDGWKNIQDIQEEFDINDINLIKPGIGETTRVLLRRIPWKILIKQENDPNLKHILVLAKEKKVPVEIYTNMTYKCCGLIKSLKGEI
ncbi:phosphoribosyltransferase [Tepidibacter sp.]|jgi:hypoxanthine-guanine phosphoribosyltransferase|uniref:phosphoribosyltransferase n=1 Tax=Tepidibacter sp. TaxID=2529387 RepID=UPI002ED0CBA7